MYTSTLSGFEALVVIPDIFGMFLTLDHKLESVPDEATCDFAEIISLRSKRRQVLSNVRQGD
jgi:hypothetical protein